MRGERFTCFLSCIKRNISNQNKKRSKRLKTRGAFLHALAESQTFVHASKLPNIIKQPYITKGLKGRKEYFDEVLEKLTSKASLRV